MTKTSMTELAFGTYENYRAEIMEHVSSPYWMAVDHAVRGINLGDTVLAAWAARLARELLAERHPSTKLPKPTRIDTNE